MNIGSLPSRPRLPTNLDVNFEPPDESGEERLVFMSERHRVVLRGRSLREVQRHLLPLLDGKHTLGQIRSQVADVFAPTDLDRFLLLLMERQLLQDAERDTLSEATRAEYAPQLNFFHEIDLDPDRAQRTLMGATVVVLGLAGVGAHAALALASAGVGTIRCFDNGEVLASDAHLAGVFGTRDLGRRRVEVVSDRIREVNSEAVVLKVDKDLSSDEEVETAVQGAGLVVCCLDASLASILYRVNRICYRKRIPWTTCSASGLEGILGPTVVPGQTPCYLCYQMRAVACSDNPPAAFSRLRFLDRRNKDDSYRRENHVFAVGVMGHLVGLEALKLICGAGGPTALGRIVAVDFLSFASSAHIVLRKPGCPICSGAQNAGSWPETAGSVESTAPDGAR